MLVFTLVGDPSNIKSTTLSMMSMQAPPPPIVVTMLARLPILFLILMHRNNVLKQLFDPVALKLLMIIL